MNAPVREHSLQPDHRLLTIRMFPTRQIDTTLRIILILLLLAAFPAQAQKIYKCQRGNKTEFSDAPCEQDARQAEMRSRRGRPESRLRVVPTADPLIATNAKPLPLDTALAVDLFNRVSLACGRRDQGAMLELYSQTERTFIQTNWPASSLPGYLSDSLCKNLRAIVATSLQGRPESYLYATQKISGHVMLCSYASGADITECRNHIGVTIEEGKLKIDEH